MQYPNMEARNWRLAFKIIKKIFALFLSGALHLDGKQQPECHDNFLSVQAFMQCYLNPPQMTSRSATWRLFKQFKRFLPCFHVVIDICMKTNPTLDNWKIVARVLSFKIVCPFSPLKTHKCTEDSSRAGRPTTASPYLGERVT